MEYTKQQRRSRVSRIKFGSGRGLSKREEERRVLRSVKKEDSKKVKSKQPNFISRIKKTFNRNK